MYTQNDIQDLCTQPQTYRRGRALFLNGFVQNLEAMESEDTDGTILCIEGDVEGSHWNEYHVSLEYNLDLDTFTSYQCECPAYQSYPGMCKHCAALALEYLEERESSGTASIFSLKNMQHQPVHRLTTDNRILDLVKSYALQKRMNEQKPVGNIEIIPELAEDGRYYYSDEHRYILSFQIGQADGRKYVLRNLTDFVQNVQKEEKYTYGKLLSFVHSKSMFTERGWRYVQLIMQGISEAGQHYQSVTKELLLTPKLLEEFFSINRDQDIPYVSGSKKTGSLHVTEKNPPLKLQVKPIDGGFQLRIPALTILSGASRIFINIGNRIYCCTDEYAQAMSRVLKYASSDRETVCNISESDMTAFCASVLPALEQQNALDTASVSLDAYQPKQADIAFYLDEENGRVTLKPLCSYGSASYQLLDTPELSSEYHDRSREIRAMNAARAYFPYEDLQRKVLYFSSDDLDRMYQLLDTGIMQLGEEGTVYASEKIKNRNIIRSPRAQIGVSLRGGLLELSVSSDAFTSGELADILDRYQKKKKYYRLENGDFLNLEGNSVTDVAELLDGLSIPAKELAQESITVPKFRACYVDQSLRQKSGQLQVERNAGYKAILRDMKNVEDSDYQVPDALAGVLRDYQKTGYRWLCTLADLGFGGILADDMGLGKTLQAITYLLSRKYAVRAEAAGSADADSLAAGSGTPGTADTGSMEGRLHRPSLIICPASLVYNWKREIQHFAPEMTVRMIIGTASQREERIRSGGQDDVWITSYDMAKRDTAYYRNLQFDTEIIDEAQNIKNHGTMAAKAVKKIDASVRFALTGTPIENRLSELWSIFDYLMPGLLGTYEKFRKRYELPIVQNQDEILTERLKRMVSPFILRRMKQDVLKELPDKMEQVVYTQMEEEQRKLYIGHARRLKESLEKQSREEIQKGKLQILAELTRLRQLCCDPGLIYEDYHAGACKVEACLELVKDAIAGKHKVLIFSQFTSIFPVLEERLSISKIPYYELTGKTSKEERQRLTESFHTDDVPVFLISLKAGGTGLNLTAASIVIHFDPWWNLAAQNQATDRAHRIGQQEQVVVFKLIAQDTIEEKILQLQEKKQEMASQILEGEGIAASTLTKEDFMEILEF